MKDNSIKFKHPQEPFIKDIKEHVEAYFESKRKTRFADLRLYGKALIQFGLVIGSYASIISNQFSGRSLFLLQFIFYFSLFLIAVGVAHDGSHNAFSPKRCVNKTAYRIFDFLGVNTYMWDLNHIQSHHNMPNVPTYDAALDSFKLFRLHPKADKYRFHRYQHYYIFIIYAIAPLFNVFFRDIFSLTRKTIGHVNTSHSFRQTAWVFLTKFIVIGYGLVLPIYFLDAPTWQIVLGFIVGNMLVGIALGSIFMVTHVSDHSSWPNPDDHGYIENSFGRHIMETTSDFSTNNMLVTWIAGGLNHHVAHHLFPTIAHIHLPVITKIVKRCAKKHRVKYKEYDSLSLALSSHLKTIKKLGNGEIY